MDERDRLSEIEDGDALGDRIAAAGRRPPIPPEVLAALRDTALTALATSGAATARPRRGRRNAIRLAIAAALVAALALAAWIARSAVDEPAVATVAAISGNGATGAALEVATGGGTWRALAIGDEIPRGAVLRTGAGARAALRLRAGAALRLDAASRVHLTADDRLDLERGAVYADTDAAGRARAAAAGRLAIATPLGTVRHVGTQFEVRRLGELVRVRVREGAVAIERAAGGGTSVGAIPARAGEEIVLSPDGGLARRAVAAADPGWRWTMSVAGGFAIEGRRLAELLSWVARETGWRVRYDDPALEATAQTIVLHGDLGTLPPDEAPFALLPGAGLEAEVTEPGVLTVRRASSPARSPRSR